MRILLWGKTRNAKHRTKPLPKNAMSNIQTSSDNLSFRESFQEWNANQLERTADNLRLDANDVLARMEALGPITSAFLQNVYGDLVIERKRLLNMAELYGKQAVEIRKGK
jgi:hypothetical protein